MTIKRLDLISGVAAPHLAGLVATCSNDLVALRIKLNLTNLVLMSLEQSDTSSRENVVYAS